MSSAKNPGGPQLSARTLELAVVVFPLAAWRDLFGRVPMLNNFATGRSKKIVEGGMDTAVVALADAKNKAPLS